MCLRLNAASIAAPSGAEAGHVQSSGLGAPAEGLRRKPQRGLQDRPGLRAFSGARQGEGQHHSASTLMRTASASEVRPSRTSARLRSASVLPRSARRAAVRKAPASLFWMASAMSGSSSSIS